MRHRPDARAAPPGRDLGTNVPINAWESSERAGPIRLPSSTRMTARPKSHWIHRTGSIALGPSRWVHRNWVHRNWVHRAGCISQGIRNLGWNAPGAAATLAVLDALRADLTW